MHRLLGVVGALELDIWKSTNSPLKTPFRPCMNDDICHVLPSRAGRFLLRKLAGWKLHTCIWLGLMLSPQAHDRLVAERRSLPSPCLIQGENLSFPDGLGSSQVA